ncbi:MAG: transketolase, partial [Candidatus Cloacimonadota bacterium]
MSARERSKMKKESGLLKDWFIKQPDYLFKTNSLSAKTKEKFHELGRIMRGDILTMTTIAASGHPGGPMSSAEIYIVVHSLANIHPSKINDPLRDRIVVSHGHTSAGCYAVLGRLGFFNIEDALIHFRKCGSIFEGHIERKIPGCEWTTGNLGQGLSAGCGFALASKINEEHCNVFILMSDAEQAKGQVGEARRFSKQFELNNMTCIIDYNEIQISGSVHDVMHVNIKSNYESDGWNVLEVDGHNVEEIYNAIHKSINDTSLPYAIICHTTMGKGVSFMEEAKEHYHGSPLKPEEYAKAIEELGIENRIDEYRKERDATSPETSHTEFRRTPNIETGKPFNYKVDDALGNRDAFGKSLEDIAIINKKREAASPIVVLDCDLKESVRTHLFENVSPACFIEAGVQEHNTATIARVLSIEAKITYIAEFVVFGI